MANARNLSCRLGRSGGMYALSPLDNEMLACSVTRHITYLSRQNRERSPMHYNICTLNDQSSTPLVNRRTPESEGSRSHLHRRPRTISACSCAICYSVVGFIQSVLSSPVWTHKVSFPHLRDADIALPRSSPRSERLPPKHSKEPPIC